MIFITQVSKFKSFSIASFLLMSSLLVINLSFSTESEKIQTTDGDSVKAIKRIYTSMTKVIFAEINTTDQKQRVENHVSNRFISTEASESVKH